MDLINRDDAIKELDADPMGGLNYRSILERLPSAYPMPDGFDPEHLTEEDKRYIAEALDYLKDTLDTCTESQCESVQVSGQADDLISRQGAIDAISCNITVTGRQNAELVASTIGMFADRIKALPSVQPEIIYCKDCQKHNVSIEDWYDNRWKKVCPLVGYRGKAQGHEFDYQFCAYAERRTDD